MAVAGTAVLWPLGMAVLGPPGLEPEGKELLNLVPAGTSHACPALSLFHGCAVSFAASLGATELSC